MTALLRIVTAEGEAFGTDLDAATLLAECEASRDRIEVYDGAHLVAWAPAEPSLREEMLANMAKHGHLKGGAVAGVVRA